MIRVINHQTRSIQKFPTQLFNIRTDKHGNRFICVGNIPARPIKQHEQIIEG